MAASQQEVNRNEGNEMEGMQVHKRKDNDFKAGNNE